MTRFEMLLVLASVALAFLIYLNPPFNANRKRCAHRDAGLLDLI